MSEHDISLVTGQAGSIIAEGNKVSFGTASGGLTPSTISAMVGIHSNQALQIASSVQASLDKLAAQAAIVDPMDPAYIPGVSGPGGQADIAHQAMTAFHTSTGITGNQSAFGAFLSQAQNHIKDAGELQSAVTNINNTNFADLGSGITNMSSMATRGLDSVMGSLPSAANALTSAGPCFDLKDMSNFGTGTGLVNKLNSVRMGGASGINDALTANGVDITRLSDPIYSDNITKTLASIKDPAVISAVKDQLGVSPHGEIGNLNDLTDITKLANPASISGLTGGLSGMAGKLGDMGAKFPSPGAAASMLNNISIPSVPNLNSAAANLPDLLSGGTNASTINNMITGGVTSGIPTMTDFMQHVAGGPSIDSFNSASISASSISALTGSLTSAQTLFQNTGIDLTSPPKQCLGSSMSFATNLHKFGADTSGSGISDMLSAIAKPGSQYGDAIKNSLAEGKNKALMLANGIKPLSF